MEVCAQYFLSHFSQTANCAAKRPFKMCIYNECSLYLCAYICAYSRALWWGSEYIACRRLHAMEAMRVQERQNVVFFPLPEKL